MVRQNIQFNHKKRIQTETSKITAICNRTKRGWQSTLKLFGTLSAFVCQKKKGKAQWDKYILDEATEIVQMQKPPSGAYPEGAYHSTKSITKDIFSPESKHTRDHELVTAHMPFLFQSIYRKLSFQPGTATNPHLANDDDEPMEENDSIPPTDLDGNGVNPTDEIDMNSPFDHNKQAYMVAKTICAMVAFVKNQRNNSPQLTNSVTFLASGVTDWVSVFLNYIGLSSSQRTAQLALNTLGRRSRLQISQAIAKPIAPSLGAFLCFDNLDFKQRVHTKSVGHSSRMFHGTWGYVHHPNPKLVSLVLASDLTVESYQQAMSNASSFDVHSQMFLPTPQEEVQWELVIKSQITSALLDHLATQADSYVSVNKNPPVVKQISAKIPDITMLKLMIGSDNSAQGAGEVFNAIVDQSTASIFDFASRVQVVDGDLATCTNITNLQTHRIPSRHKEESLLNIVTILGGAHTLWNIGQAIYSKHLGDTSDACDSGAWRILDGLGIPFKKMLDKKDFTSMIKNIKKIQKASLVHCLI
ncbi:hypothetical protein PTTG_27552 [Puccinia triticina 1-1 BBBD Race 1]|uniref:DUF6589 domain-containing protein n=1 Tax=Puccinia triticina (isolate 1-1 / race 1 (BBBD)) TaxID=630390 RepID=A0A180GIW4_PUCT1|nr:hypothetical protein PTTG_27552 [Puccinia triticina 1-1 BBBD Race 1]